MLERVKVFDGYMHVDVDGLDRRLLAVIVLLDEIGFRDDVGLLVLGAR